MADANYLTGTVTFTTLNDNVYHTLIAAPAAPYRILTVFNATDKELLVSFDASTTHASIPANASQTWDYGTAGLVESSAVSIKLAVDATTGNVIGNAVTG